MAHYCVAEMTRGKLFNSFISLSKSNIRNVDRSYKKNSNMHI